MKLLKPVLTAIFVIASSILILVLRTIQVSFLNVQLFGLELGHEMSYQLLTLIVAVLAIIMSVLLSNKQALEYLNSKNYSAEVKPVKAIGLVPEEGETWKHVGSNFSVIISVITALVIFLQVVRGQTVKQSFFIPILPAILFALINAFNEEMIYRFSISTVFIKNKINPTITALSSGIIFGAVHYWGTPGGIPGVIMAGFIGWFLSKSIIENKGIFWALFIHFLQDVIIFYAKFLTL